MKKINYLDFPKEYKERKGIYLNAFDRVMKKGVYVLGDEVHNFEGEFSKYLGSKYCIGVANGLEALQISLMAIGIGNGDEVITTPLSAVATTLAIMAVDATPIFVDIKENGQLDENLIEKAITKKTKAVMPVHLYGQPLEIEKINDICKKHKLFLIEDACQAHGTKFKGKIAGTFGDISCFSFYPTKNLGAIGDGGAISTNDEKMAKIMYQLRDYGQETKYMHTRYGLNSRLDELQASVLREKLRFLDKDNNKRSLIAKRYVDRLLKNENIKMILPSNFDDSNFHLFVIKTSKRDLLKEYLLKNGIPSLIHYPISIPDQPMFKGRYNNLEIPVTRKLISEILSIPCHPFMQIQEVDYVCKAINEFFNK
ncbi:hypothetical protein A2422_02330 [Candidatus Woesebacteria bacterium RIFOXYC1_FULL_31_51]|uniref:Glutamine-scyllo-inositol transaminase n=1 Tax=Candidatus Woesebacteria bacterium GW2011_GWC2_31_9 TaxID=1618586 RepID=A0A0F9YJ24_9BACT|nr:MAG: glutamine--scyllo-inositol transaminase [Candidatus Woesebacteria bacterium GW2011_GWF1_31_35]KKP23532.1 MAG: Glutamine-scyllo-inositol transaminase [Candidatus Woesebacteria bacterium GW2011_GWC1_30_29]KKP25710.1 MAG: Glutamine-scyllo-inositol transaminase [Candidatus Woesebacteria bacterium GW2011_GWD1_31_12]KKP27808.1 MAG: Glutamine-scyllo-inositol transaminase [Candidatus Woesebacteria bacterium GW2011_GWB1_31_29]KKP31333.1 MAG: Glutamine-scyllo-inositol transaminase [Candidatus Woe